MLSITRLDKRGQQHQLPLNKKRRFSSPKARRMFSFCRWLHIYVSCALFSLLLFFCITGITLNHPDWASTKPEQVRYLDLPSHLRLTEYTQEYPVKKIQSYIESKTGLSHPRSVDLALEFGEITYDYPLPAGYAYVTVLVEEQTIEIEHVEGDILALMNDLHKGRHSGQVWSWLIDLSALLMMFFTLTGLFILFQNTKHRRHALYIVCTGIVTPLAIYWLAVPRLI